MATGNEELEQFKTQINLCDYAHAQGFQLDRKQSSRASAVMRHPCGDKIVIAKRPSGHWVYFNVHGSDNGTIIDFVSARKALSIGLIRKELRPWVRGGGDPVPNTQSSARPSPKQHNLVASTHNFDQVSRSWARSHPLPQTNVYLQGRGIPAATIAEHVFADRVRIDERNNCIFPHWDRSGTLCGFEIKNSGFTGFSPGGVKGLWCSRPKSSDSVMVVCESAIDALSFAAIFGVNDKRFFSTAGTCSPNQVASLISAARRMPNGSSVWLAFDNDDGGRLMADNLANELANANVGLQIFEKLPAQQNSDWNDVLQERRNCSAEITQAALAESNSLKI